MVARHDATVTPICKYSSDDPRLTPCVKLDLYQEQIYGSIYLVYMSCIIHTITQCDIKA